MFMLWGLSTGKTLEARTMGRRDYSPSLISHEYIVDREPSRNY